MAELTLLGGYLITSAESEPKADRGLRIEGSRIVEIAPNSELKRTQRKGKLIDYSDSILMPGLVNTHMHMYGMLAHGMPMEGALSDLYYDLVDWWWPDVEDQMDHEAIRASTALSAATLIRSGVTTVCDVMEAPYALPGCLDVAAHVLDNAGMRAILMFEATERVGPENARMGLEPNRQEQNLRHDVRSHNFQLLATFPEAGSTGRR
jgi:5-methylthioadenosine/S-adenosylhomocysteine deaminase